MPAKHVLMNLFMFQLWLWGTAQVGTSPTHRAVISFPSSLPNAIAQVWPSCSRGLELLVFLLLAASTETKHHRSSLYQVSAQKLSKAPHFLLDISNVSAWHAQFFQSKTRVTSQLQTHCKHSCCLTLNHAVYSTWNAFPCIRASPCPIHPSRPNSGYTSTLTRKPTSIVLRWLLPFLNPCET